MKASLNRIRYQRRTNAWIWCAWLNSDTMGEWLQRAIAVCCIRGQVDVAVSRIASINLSSLLVHTLLVSPFNLSCCYRFNIFTLSVSVLLLSLSRSVLAVWWMRKLSSKYTPSSFLTEVHSESVLCSSCLHLRLCHAAKCFTLVSPADASTYAHFLFNAFDSAHTGSIKFEVCLGYF